MTEAPIIKFSENIATLEQEIINSIRQLKNDSIMSPAIILTGSHIQSLYLQRLIAKNIGALINVRFLTLQDITKSLALIGHKENQSFQFPEAAEIILIQKIASKFITSSSNPSLFRLSGTDLNHAINKSIHDLREGNIKINPTIINAIKNYSQLLDKIIKTYESSVAFYEDEIIQLRKSIATDDSELAKHFYNYSSYPVPNINRGSNSISLLIYGIYDFNALQLNLIKKLSNIFTTQMFLPSSSSNNKYNFSWGNIKRLELAGFKKSIINYNSLSSITRKKRIISAPSETSEIKEIVRCILEDTSAGILLNNIAILHHSDQILEERLASTLKQANLLYYRPEGQGLRWTPIGRIALMILDLFYKKPTRSSLLELITIPNISFSWINPAIVESSGDWELLSKKLGLIAGWDQFIEMLSLQYLSDKKLTHRRKKSQTTDFNSIVQAFALNAKKINLLKSWQQHTENLLIIYQNLFLEMLPSEEFLAIKIALNKFFIYDRADLPLSKENFYNSCKTTIEQLKIPVGSFQQTGLFLGHVRTARMIRFDQVYMMNCTEQEYPPATTQDPLLSDKDRQKINNLSNRGFLSLSKNRVSEERQLLELMCQTGIKKVTHSYQRKSRGSKELMYPSTFLLQEVENITGSICTSENLLSIQQNWIKILPNRLGFPIVNTKDYLRAIDDSDFRIALLETCGLEAVNTISPLLPFWNRQQNKKKSYLQQHFGEFDGIIPPSLIHKTGILSKEFSASALNSYTKCPYSFFLSKILSLNSQVEPTLKLETPAHVRGTIVHEVLEEIFRKAISSSESANQVLNKPPQILETIVANKFAEHKAELSCPPISLHLSQKKVITDIKAYLSHNDGSHAIDTEIEFSRVPIETGNRTLYFRGKIDRLDVLLSGMKIIDYKTGKVARNQNKEYRTGKSLQLPIYLYALTNIKQLSIQECFAELHCIGQKSGNNTFSISGKDITSDNRFIDILRTIAKSIEEGIFFYNPGKDRINCTHCDFKSICHNKVLRHRNNKEEGSKKTTELFLTISEEANQCTK